MTVGPGTNRLLAGAALAGIVAAAGIVGLLLSGKPPHPTPSPSATPSPSITYTLSPVECRNNPSSAPAVPSTSPTPVPAQPVSTGLDSVVDDPATHQVVLFGGGNSDSTWIWAGRHWTLMHPSASPSARFYAAAAYDPVSRQVMLYGGRLVGGDVACDTWAWTGSTWVELDKGNNQLPPGELAQMGWDASRQEMVLIARGDTGLETFVWKGGWVRQPHGDLPGSYASGVVFDAASRSLLMVASGSPPTSAATWQWDGAAWKPLSGPTPASFLDSMAVDPGTGQPLLLPEPGDSPSTESLWRWDGTGWTAVPGSTQLSLGPSEIVTDVEGGRLILFGLTTSSQQAPQTLHVWAWTGGGWRRLD